MQIIVAKHTYQLLWMSQNLNSPDDNGRPETLRFYSPSPGCHTLILQHSSLRMSYKITIQLLSGWRSFLAFYSMRFKQATPLLVFLESPKLLYLRTATISLCFPAFMLFFYFPIFLSLNQVSSHTLRLANVLSFIFIYFILYYKIYKIFIFYIYYIYWHTLGF